MAFPSWALHILCSTILVHYANCACSNTPIDLNTATAEELDSLPFISSTTAQLIIDLRPICSPQELTEGAKKIWGITSWRLQYYWEWYSQQDEAGYSCDDTCCKAIASCDDATGNTGASATYSWQTGDFSECSAECDTGTQYRTITCGNETHTVDDSLCLASNNGVQPVDKQFCNTQKCPVYEWIASEWSACDDQCIQTRNIECYETMYNTLEDDTKCSENGIEYAYSTTQSCDRCLTMDNTEIIKINDDISVEIDLLNDYNAQQCHTDLYRNIDDIAHTLITRRSCYVDIAINVFGNTDDVVDAVDISWFYLDVTLKANTDESVAEWSDYLSWTGVNATSLTSGRISLTFPSDANIGQFECALYYQHQGVEADRVLLKDAISIFVLFNPYSESDDTYMSSTTDRQEYIENEDGLIWQGSSSDNAGYIWDYAHFEYKNLLISMKMLDRLPLEYRNDLVIISRQISYAVGSDICYGKWGSGSYTSGKPYGGYYCSSTRSCHDPLSWRGSTDLFDVYRDELNYAYSVQYCQCFVFAGVTTTVGRALGIATRPVSTFQSSHDTDFNRAIDKYWIYDVESSTYEASTSGGDSVWSFHVWNEMYFKRSDFINSASSYNMKGWQVVDATPQEQSYGGNPALSDDDTSVYQLGPASLLLIKRNINTNECVHAAVSANKERYGCFDTEFVISEVNANYNFWWKKSTDAKDAPFLLEDSYKSDPWGDDIYTIGQQISTKKPGAVISPQCLDDAINDCSADLLDVTWDYKYGEPSSPSIPTDTTNHYTQGQTRNAPGRRRMVLFTNDTDTEIDFDTEAIQYEISSIPELWSLTPMIVADDDYTHVYGADYTYGMMSIHIDSYFDEALDVYCSFTVTAHDYTGQELTNDSVKLEKMHVSIDAGESNACAFYVNYTEYSRWTDVVDQDVSSIAHHFKFVLSVSIFDNVTQIEPYKVIIEEREFLVCSPIYKLRDRIVCHNGLKWFQASYGLDYECDDAPNGIESIGDGFCDDNNNIDACFDGGDCCASSCVPSDLYSCDYFNCIDDRVNVHSIDYFSCNDVLSFVTYIDDLMEQEICADFESLLCSDAIWIGSTGDACVDSVLDVQGQFGDIETCFNETRNSISTQMQSIIGLVIECMAWLQTLDNATYIPSGYYNGTDTYGIMKSTYTVGGNVESDNSGSQSDKTSSASKSTMVLIVILALIVIGLIAIWLRSKQREKARLRKKMQVRDHEDDIDEGVGNTTDKVEMEPREAEKEQIV